MTLRDITEQRRLERPDAIWSRRLHDSKTPLAAIKGLMELLQGGRGRSRAPEQFLSLMEVESVVSSGLVEEQLQLARLDSGAMPLELEQLDLDGLADGSWRRAGRLPTRPGLRSTARYDGVVIVDADPARIEQFLLILLDNAFRHTPAGGSITVSARRTDTDAQLAVADTGEGIPPDEQAFVFDRFYRGDPSREGRSAASGLRSRAVSPRRMAGISSSRRRCGVGSTSPCISLRTSGRIRIPPQSCRPSPGPTRYSLRP